MAVIKQRKYVPANSVDVLVEVNDVLVRNAKAGIPAAVYLPTLFNRAFLLFHEAGVLPVESVVTEKPNG